MSARQLLKTFRSGLFYFSSDKTLMVLPTKYISDEMYQVGMVVRLRINNKEEQAEIINLSGKRYCYIVKWLESLYANYAFARIM